MEEIFSKLSAHFIKGMMVHDQMSRYYDFLGLKGYKRCHEHQFYEDAKIFRRINRYYINHHSKLVPEMRVEDPALIPESWYNYSREDVDPQTKRNSVESGINKWVEWERTTKRELESAIKTLQDNGFIEDAMWLRNILKKVSYELKKAERHLIELKGVSFDLIYITEEQEKVHDKYKEKMKKYL